MIYPNEEVAIRLLAKLCRLGLGLYYHHHHEFKFGWNRIDCDHIDRIKFHGFLYPQVYNAGNENSSVHARKSPRGESH